MLEWVLSAQLLNLTDFSYLLFFPASSSKTSPNPRSYSTFFPKKFTWVLNLFLYCAVLASEKWSR